MIHTPSGLEAFPPTQILRNFWIGNVGDAAKLSVTNELGIEAVINCCGDNYIQAPGVEYLTCALEDGQEVPEDKFWMILNKGVELYQADKTTLIHCAAGMSRSVGMSIAIFHAAKILEFEAAMTFIKRRRPIARPHHLILLSARKYLKLWPYSEEWTQK